MAKRRSSKSGQRTDARKIDKAVAAKISDMRRARDLFQVDVADRMGITVAKISRIERGVSAVKPSMLIGLARVFGCRPEDFLEGVWP